MNKERRRQPIEIQDNMEAKEIMSKFDELYGMMASSTNVKYMHTLK